MQPKIIISQDRQKRDKIVWDILNEFQITQNNPDLLIIDEEKIHIAQARQIIYHLSTKPFGKTAKSVIIFNGNNIGPEAQNALLKTLEEPPGESLILIGVDSESRFLPTVLSRCQLINQTSPPVTLEQKFNLDQILSSSLEKRFELIEKTSDKEQFLKDLTESYRQKMLKGEASTQFLEELLQSEIWKEANVNIRTILEYLMLKLPK